MRIFWTDGSANPNPGPGGYAVIEEKDGEFLPVRFGSEEKSSNIRMEGSAIGAAIKFAAPEKCEIHTDSEFWKNVLEEWAPDWEKNGWAKKPRKVNERGELAPIPNKDAIKNLTLVRAVYELYKKYQPEIVWTRGHVGILGNEMADEFANKARKGLTIDNFNKGKEENETSDY